MLLLLRHGAEISCVGYSSLTHGYKTLDVAVMILHGGVVCLDVIRTPEMTAIFCEKTDSGSAIHGIAFPVYVYLRSVILRRHSISVARAGIGAGQ